MSYKIDKETAFGPIGVIGQIALRPVEVAHKNRTEQLLKLLSTVDKSVKERITKKKGATEMFVQVLILNET